MKYADSAMYLAKHCGRRSFRFYSHDLTRDAATRLSLESELRTLLALRSMGLSIAIDDFGTGYSPLSYLARFPIDTLKIDRSFVHKMTTDRCHAELVKAILSIAKCLGQDVVAEGVETPEQANFLQVNGCRFAQGFLFGGPLQKSTLVGRPAALEFAQDQP